MHPLTKSFMTAFATFLTSLLCFLHLNGCVTGMIGDPPGTLQEADNLTYELPPGWNKNPKGRNDASNAGYDQTYDLLPGQAKVEFGSQGQWTEEDAHKAALSELQEANTPDSSAKISEQQFGGYKVYVVHSKGSEDGSREYAILSFVKGEIGYKITLFGSLERNRNVMEMLVRTLQVQ